MSFGQAERDFLKALEVAEKGHDSAAEFLASGLAEMARSLQSLERDLRSVKDTAEKIKRRQ